MHMIDAKALAIGELRSALADLQTGALQTIDLPARMQRIAAIIDADVQAARSVPGDADPTSRAPADRPA
jgi:hypothetical protein